MSKLDTKKENLNSALENDKRKETENKEVYIRPPVTHKHHRKGKREKQEQKPQVLLEVIAQRRVASAPPCVVWSSPTVAHSQPSEFFRCSGFPRRMFTLSWSASLGTEAVETSYYLT